MADVEWAIGEAHSSAVAHLFRQRVAVPGARERSVAGGPPATSTPGSAAAWLLPRPPSNRRDAGTPSSKSQ